MYCLMDPRIDQLQQYTEDLQTAFLCLYGWLSVLTFLLAYVFCLLQELKEQRPPALHPLQQPLLSIEVPYQQLA